MSTEVGRDSPGSQTQGRRARGDSHSSAVFGRHGSPPQAAVDFKIFTLIPSLREQQLLSEDSLHVDKHSWPPGRKQQTQVFILSPERLNRGALTCMCAAPPEVTPPCFPHCCRASGEDPGEAVRRASPSQGGNWEGCPHHNIDLNGSVRVPIASSDGETKVQSCRGALELSGLRLQEGQRRLTLSRSFTS